MLVVSIQRASSRWRMPARRGLLREAPEPTMARRGLEAPMPALRACDESAVVAAGSGKRRPIMTWGLWIAMGCALLVGVTWAGSWLWCLECRQRELAVWISRGAISAMHPAGYPLDWPRHEHLVWYWRARRVEVFLVKLARGFGLVDGFLGGGLPSIGFIPGCPLVTVRIPCWIPFASVVVPAIWLWHVRCRPAGNHKCVRCGYDLTGNVSGHCPECGTPARQPMRERAEDQ